MSDDMARFSDGELRQLRADFEAHRERQERAQGELTEMVERNTRTTRELAESVRSVAESTEGVVKAYQDLQAAARVGVSVQRFFAWVAKWGVIGGGIVVGLRWVIDYFMPPPGG